MFVKMKATRHTKIGTLRAGITYNPEQMGDKAADVFDALVEAENSVAVVLTADEADAEKAAVGSLVPTDAADKPAKAQKKEAE